MGRLMRLLALIAALAMTPSPLPSSTLPSALPDPTPPAPAIRANDNLVVAGQFARHELHLSLDARWGRWYPDGPNGTAVPIQAFAEDGKIPQVPGPLIRVPAGTIVVVRIRNSIPDTRLTVHGLMDRPALRDSSFDVPFAQTRLVRFRAGVAGTYYYWGSTTGSSLTRRFGADSQLNGALVIDPPNIDARTPRDRIFVIGQWINVRNDKGLPDFKYELGVINGRAWPETERLSYARGSTVHWRLIDAAFGYHPMHLHGFYFRVDSRGDGAAETVYRSDADRDLRVTELVTPGETLALTWKASRAGNWLFHCHLTFHSMAHMPLAEMAAGKQATDVAQYYDHFLRDAEMGGLILAISVGGPVRKVVEPRVSRRFTLFVESAPDDRPGAPSYKYALAEGGKTVTEPGAIGPPILLTRGVSVAIDVTNRLPEATAVHWHGMELDDSYYDGVAGHSGAGERRAPMIEPGQTFQARMTPPRSGTFIYHTHMNDIHQLRAGLAGPLIVLDPGQEFDLSIDHIFTITTPHTLADAGKIFVNGVLAPPALTVRAGVRQRLRFLNVTTAQPRVIVSLSSGNRTLRWQPLAVDGADLPIARRTPQSAVQTVTVGATRDFFFTPARGTSLLQIWKSPKNLGVTIPVEAI
jgi:FtsP/CotA-like multicopper oxidase with cupredoxin domain